MARAIIRFSLDGDDGRVTTRVTKLLEGKGFSHGGTASHEAHTISEADLSAVVNAMVNLMPPDGSVVIDHLWVFMDRADSN